MEEKEFFRRLKERDFINLERDLLEDYNKTKDLKNKYYLGICYSADLTKYEEAIVIFKELLNTEYKHPNMYLFMAKHSQSRLESEKIIKQGIKNFPNNNNLKNELLFYLCDEKKEEYFETLKKETKVTFNSMIEMINFYYKNKNYIKALELINNITDERSLNKPDVKFLKIIIPYLANQEVNRELIDIFTVADNNSFSGMIVKLIEIDIEKDDNVAKKLIRQLNYTSEYNYLFHEIMFERNSIYFPLDEIFFTIITKIKERFDEREIDRKIELIEIFQKLYSDEYRKTITKNKLKEIEKIIKEELKDIDDKDLYLNLMYIYEMMNNKKKYFEICIEMIKNFHTVKHINLYNFTPTDLNSAVNYVICNANIHEYNSDNYQNIIELLIKKLHKHKMYSDIVKLIDSIDYKKLDYLSFGFELAYALDVCERKNEAK